ncbi:hypothetical protein SEA_KENREY_245 [Streptomyces phage Kenrey]|nr:hypothetical protein SEA_KENREY_245 [Streptomyces phage Kenrey]
MFEIDWFVTAQSIGTALAFAGIGVYRGTYCLPVGGNFDRIFYWWFAMGWISSAIIRIIHGQTPIVDVMFAVYDLYKWWNAGGGDGIKNFLQSLVMKPAHAVR